MLQMTYIKFYAKCKKCENEEEFEYLCVDGREFDCLRCGNKLKNEIDTEFSIIPIN